ncbi:head GIN domain-containing protein [Bacteroidota bacterium]
MKTKAPISILFLVILTLTFVACENSAWNCLRGNGIIEKETRDLSQYNGVVTEGEFDVFYVPDSVYSVEIEADQNLIPYIRTRISGTTLIVDNGTRKCLRSEYPIRIYVRAPEIKLMSLVGSGMLSAETVYTDELTLSIEGSGLIDISGIDVLDLNVLITGSGDVSLWGDTDVADYTITGSGNIDARNVLSTSCIAEISGSGSIYCNVESKLDAIISGSGTIYYWGTPSVSTHISGSGSVVSNP